jgi:uncharacterized repeat protein (TIGR03803 family)
MAYSLSIGVKTSLKKLRLLPVLFAALGLMLPYRATAQTFTNLHSFTAVVSTTNSDGANPSGSLVLSGSTLYGTTEDGGIFGQGVVFALNLSGTIATNLHNFSAETTNRLGIYTNSDGADPAANLILSGNAFYGTAEFGGSNGNGTIFSLPVNGTGFTNIHNFSASMPNAVGRSTNADGADPQCGLILSGGTFYGTASGGGNAGNGAVFRVNTDGTGFTNLHSFTAYATTFPGTNSDGYYPQAGLVLSGNVLYGTATYGGVFGRGSVFRLNTDGTGFTNMHSFTAFAAGINNDGATPFGGLVLSGNILYGAATYGGTKSYGAVYAIHTDGSGFTNFYNFTGYPRGAENPVGTLLLSGNVLYGTGEFGGSADEGSVFQIKTDGSGFTNLYNFSSALGTYPNFYNSDGYNPYAALILSGNTLYGTALEGGVAGFGAVFSLTLPVPPPLTISLSGANIILLWPTNNATGFTLQSTTNLISAAWTTIVPAPVVVNTNNAVTNTLSGLQKFYRLSQ